MRLAVTKKTIPTCEEETRLRTARKRLAVKKRRALETRRLRPAKKRLDLRRTSRRETEYDSDLRGRDSTPTCDEVTRRDEEESETRLRPAQKRLGLQRTIRRETEDDSDL